MLQALLDSLESGDLSITVIPLNLNRKPIDHPVADEALVVVDKMIATEKTVRRMVTLLEGHGYTNKADRLKTWWTTSIAPIDEIIDRITAATPTESNADELISDLTELAKTATPVVEFLTEKVQAIAARHMLSVCETDIDDLLI